MSDFAKDACIFTKSIPYTCTLDVDRTEFTLKEEVLFQKGLSLKLEELKEILSSSFTQHQACRKAIDFTWLFNTMIPWSGNNVPMAMLFQMRK